jgi:hypothetical protein
VVENAPPSTAGLVLDRVMVASCMSITCRFYFRCALSRDPVSNRDASVLLFLYEMAWQAFRDCYITLGSFCRRGRGTTHHFSSGTTRWARRSQQRVAFPLPLIKTTMRTKSVFASNAGPQERVCETDDSSILISSRDHPFFAVELTFDGKLRKI